MERPISINYHRQYIWQKYISPEYNYNSSLPLRSQYYCGKIPSIFYAPQGKSTKNIEVRANNQKGHYNGTMRCRNSWSCPICTPILMAKHADRITQIIEQQQEQGVTAFMITFGIPHYIHQSAETVLNELFTLYRSFIHGYKWRTVSKALEIKGIIQSTECTYTRNGFHFHKHALIFIPEERLQDILNYEEELIADWQKRFFKLGYEAQPKAFTNEKAPGLYISRNAEGKIVKTICGDYLCWDGGAELTQGHNKETRRADSKPIFQLLDGDENDKQKFFEYALACAGRKRLSYSRSLKVNEEEIENDIEIENSQPEGGGGDYELIAVFTPSQWGELIYCEQINDFPLRAEVIKAAIIGKYPAVRALCMEWGLDPPYKTHEEAEAERQSIDVAL